MMLGRHHGVAQHPVIMLTSTGMTIHTAVAWTTRTLTSACTATSTTTPSSGCVGPDSLVLSFTRYLPRSLLATLTFHVWDNSGFEWLEVAERTLYLSQLANNAATGMPSVSGTATVGETLTASNSGIADTDGLPSNFAYQWVRVDGSDETDISGATSGTYTLTDDDDGKTVKVVISFTDKFSVEETVTSDPLSSSGTVQTSTSRSVANAAPTASNNRVMTAEDTAYTFSATDKGYIFR